MDPASSKDLNLQKQEVDLGQTLGAWGVGQGFYIVWPVIGPSSPRDSFEIVGESFLYPVSYISPWYAWFGVRGLEEVNRTSLSIGDYEALKEAAIDPYVALRDAYVQYRWKKVKMKRGAQMEELAPGGVRMER
jgi:phospholipid-binding lipoprotein MlaA